MAAMIDTADLPMFLAKRVTWYAAPARRSKTKFYVFAKFYDPTKRKARTVGMHRFIMGEPPGMDVDHDDNNGLNNKRLNLKIMTHLENCRRSREPRDWAAFDARKAKRAERRTELAAIRKIIEETGYSRQYVWQIRMGRMRNADVYARLVEAGAMVLG